MMLAGVKGSGRRKKRPRGRPRSHSAPAILAINLVKKRKLWTDESMCAAIEAVKGGTSIYRAAIEHGVPRMTLQNRISGRVVHGKKSGPKPYLTSTEEKEVADFLVQTAKAGYGRSRKQIMQIAEKAARDKKLLAADKTISNGWFCRFMGRQPQLALRKGDPIANVRLENTTKEVMKEYFELLKTTLTENNLLDKPSQLYNVDETGIPLDHKPPKLVAHKGQKKVRSKTSGNKSQITVIACVNATGQTIPPFVIFDAKMLNVDWTKGEVPGTRYGMSAKGWVDTYLFKKWLKDHLLKHAVPTRPLLLILDGHGSHYQPELVQYAKENGVILFCLPPHTTHESQPLDTCVFKPLKQNWQEVCHNYMQANPGKVVTKFTFSTLFNEAWVKTMTPAVIISGFKRSGIYPFNPEALDYGMNTDVTKKTKQTTTESARLKSQTSLKNAIHFSAEQEKKFQRRYEEGFNIADPEYLQWLEINHPSEEDNTDSFLQFHDDSPQNTELEELIQLRLKSDQEGLSCVEIISDEEWSQDEMAFNESPHMPNVAVSALVNYSSSDEDGACLGPSHQPSVVSQDKSHGEKSISTSGKGTSGLPTVPPPEHEGELNYVSKYLIQYIPVKPQKVSAAGKRAPGARVLTSDECVKISRT